MLHQQSQMQHFIHLKRLIYTSLGGCHLLGEWLLVFVQSTYNGILKHWDINLSEDKTQTHKTQTFLLLKKKKNT